MVGTTDVRAPSATKGNVMKRPKRGRPVDSVSKRERFAYLYATRGDWPAKRCAMEAGYAASAAAATGSSLLKVPAIQERVKQIIATEPHVIVRLNKREREKLYSQYYEEKYREKFFALLAGMGKREAGYVMNRQDKNLEKKWRRQGNQDYNVLHKQSVKYALDYCDKRFGPVNRKKMTYNPFTEKMQYRSVKGCAYIPKNGEP